MIGIAGLLRGHFLILRSKAYVLLNQRAQRSAAPLEKQSGLLLLYTSMSLQTKFTYKVCSAQV